MASHSRQVLSVAADLLVLLGSAGSVVFGVFAGEGGGSHVRSLILAAGCAVVAVSVTWGRGYLGRRAVRDEAAARQKAEAGRLEAEEHAASAQKNAEARLIFALRARLSPILYYLGRIAAGQPEAQTAEALGRLTQAVVSAATESGDAQASRGSAFFKLSNGKMECDSYAGYEGLEDVGSTVFTDTAGDPLGRYMFQLLAERKVVLIPDVGAPEVTVTFPARRSYQSLIAAAVTAGDTLYGILTLGAPQPRSLGESDRETIKTLASLLAICLALASPQGPRL
jgi:GAF domain-containing protein